jgi:antitoxin ParD1/3/4
MELAKRTISLQPKHNTYIKNKLKSGEFATASEVVRAGLRALQERDQAIEYWLKGEVAATYDEMKEHPERGIPIEEAWKMLDARRKKS